MEILGMRAHIDYEDALNIDFSAYDLRFISLRLFAWIPPGKRCKIVNERATKCLQGLND